jgi:transcription initiation factor TFIIIB Brf1 subunit/transcription initiation factor TFIIB
MRNVQRKSRRGNQNIYFVTNNITRKCENFGIAREVTDNNTTWRRKGEICLRNN